MEPDDAHDLRNALAAARCYLQLAAHAGDPGDRARRLAAADRALTRAAEPNRAGIVTQTRTPRPGGRGVRRSFPRGAGGRGQPCRQA